MNSKYIITALIFYLLLVSACSTRSLEENYIEVKNYCGEPYQEEIYTFTELKETHFVDEAGSSLIEGTGSFFYWMIDSELATTQLLLPKKDSPNSYFVFSTFIPPGDSYYDQEYDRFVEAIQEVALLEEGETLDKENRVYLQSDLGHGWRQAFNLFTFSSDPIPEDLPKCIYGNKFEDSILRASLVDNDCDYGLNNVESYSISTEFFQVTHLSNHEFLFEMELYQGENKYYLSYVLKIEKANLKKEPYPMVKTCEVFGYFCQSSIFSDDDSCPCLEGQRTVVEPDGCNPEYEICRTICQICTATDINGEESDPYAPEFITYEEKNTSEPSSFYNYVSYPPPCFNEADTNQGLLFL